MSLLDFNTKKGKSNKGLGLIGGFNLGSISGKRKSSKGLGLFKSFKNYKNKKVDNKIKSINNLISIDQNKKGYTHNFTKKKKIKQYFNFNDFFKKEGFSIKSGLKEGYKRYKTEKEGINKDKNYIADLLENKRRKDYNKSLKGKYYKWKHGENKYVYTRVTNY